MPQRSQSWAVALLVAVFLVGAAAGLGFRARSARPGLHHRSLREAVAYLTKELSLSAVQQDSVRVVLERRRTEMDSLWRATRPRIDSLRATMRAEISRQLTPSQQARFHEIVAEHDRVRRAADSANEQLGDYDRDGVRNGIDACPHTAPGMPVDATGCPAHPDRDGVR